MLAVAVLVLGCGRRPPCVQCDTVVIAATGEPTSIFPPLVFETVGRDVSDQIYERLADLMPGRAPIDSTAYRPRLASSWERVDSLTWRFHLRKGARWSDGAPVTAEDVRFSFEVFADPAVDAAARQSLEGKVLAVVVDSTTVLIRFARVGPDQLYDATFHVRVIPQHVWGAIPRAHWPEDTVLNHVVGSGRYHLVAWHRGESLTLQADTTAPGAPEVRRIVWRFASDPDAALNLVLAHEADALEAVGSPERAARVVADTSLVLLSYPSATYGFLGFQLATAAGRPHLILGDRAVRRALVSSANRIALGRSVFGPETKAPPGPMSQLLWIWNDSIKVLPYDTVAAGRMLDAAGWRRPKGEDLRRKGKTDLQFDILVPSTSPSRRRLAVALQEMWREAGVSVTVTTVDFPVFQQRLGAGQFDSYLGAWLDEPSPRGLADQWTRTGFGALNYGHYSNRAFDTLVARASRESSPVAARQLWRAAMDTLNADAPAVFLYSPTNQAVLQRRLQEVTLDPYSWLSGIADWKVDPRRHLVRGLLSQ